MKDGMKLGIKIAVPVLMLLAVLGVFIGKNISAKNALPENDNGPFALYADYIDIEVLKAQNVPFIIDFGAEECKPCKMMKPVLVQLNKEMKGKALIKFVDVWKNPSAVQGFPVTIIPTQVFYDASGNPYQPSDALKGKINFQYANNATFHQGALSYNQMRAILSELGVR